MDIQLNPQTAPVITDRPLREDKTETSRRAQLPRSDTIDTSASDDSDNCFFRCLTYIKEQVTDFFSWLCSCFSSGEKSSKKGKSFEKPEEDLESYLSTMQNMPPEAMAVIDSLQPMIASMKKRGEELDKQLKERYKKPVENDQQALLYLADLFKVIRLSTASLTAVVTLSLTGGDHALMLEPLDKLMGSPIPTEISKEEERATIKMIKSLRNEAPSVLEPIAENKAQCKKLVAYMNEIRKPDKLPPLKIPKSSN